MPKYPILFVHGQAMTVSITNDEEGTMNDQWYLECTNADKKQHKFYEVTLVQTGGLFSVSVRHGRIGVKGKGRTLVVKSGLNRDSAVALATSIIEGKEQKGYKVKSSKKSTLGQKEDEPSRFGRLSLD
jgi:predicted DNA-binding WGR domain protein